MGAVVASQFIDVVIMFRPVPDIDQSIPVASGQQVAGGAEGEGGDSGLMEFQGSYGLSGMDVPQPGSVIPASGWPGYCRRG